MSEEQKVPSKEEILEFLKEQIEVKSQQLHLQELNTKLAEARANELKALSFIAQMTTPQPSAPGKTHILTEEDMVNNPELEKEGFKAGDQVMVAEESSTVEQPKKERGLKKK
jgi:hypothetical protein